MKGPYEHLKYDLRRVWECPHCHHRERSDGSVTSRRCRCNLEDEVFGGPVMRLVEDGCRPTHPRETTAVASTAPSDAADEG